jgi:hypothetical protein
VLKKALKLFYHKHYRFKKVKILSRTACLGDEIIKKMGWSKNCINHQKSRVDYLLALASDSSISPKPGEIIKYLKNKFIIGTIEQQKKDLFMISVQIMQLLIFMKMISTHIIIVIKRIKILNQK